MTIKARAVMVANATWTVVVINVLLGIGEILVLVTQSGIVSANVSVILGLVAAAINIVVDRIRQATGTTELFRKLAARQ